MHFADLPPRARMGFYALFASVAFALLFFAMTSAALFILWRGGWAEATAPDRIRYIAWIALGALATAAMTVLSLGMAINRRSIKWSGPGGISGEMGGGHDALSEAPPDSATVTTTTATIVATGEGR